MGMHFKQQTTAKNPQTVFDHNYPKSPEFRPSVRPGTEGQTVALSNEVWAFVPGKGFTSVHVVKPDANGKYQEASLDQIKSAYSAIEAYCAPGEPFNVTAPHEMDDQGNHAPKSLWNITTYDLTIDDQIRVKNPDGTLGPIDTAKRAALIEHIKALAANVPPTIDGKIDPDWVPLVFNDDSARDHLKTWSVDAPRPFVMNEHTDGGKIHLRIQISRVHYDAKPDPTKPGALKDVRMFGRKDGQFGLGLLSSARKPGKQVLNRVPSEDSGGAGFNNWTEFLRKKGFEVAGFNATAAPDSIYMPGTDVENAHGIKPVLVKPDPLAAGVALTTPAQSRNELFKLGRIENQQRVAKLTQQRNEHQKLLDAFNVALATENQIVAAQEIIAAYDDSIGVALALAGSDLVLDETEELDNVQKFEAAMAVLEKRETTNKPLVETGLAFKEAVDAVKAEGMTPAELEKAQAELKTQHVKGDIDDEELAEKLAELEAVIPSIDIADITPAAAVSSYVEKAEFEAKVQELAAGEDGQVDVFIEAALKGVTPLKALESHVVLAEVKDSLESSGIELKGVGVAAAVDGVLTDYRKATKELDLAKATVEKAKPLFAVLEHLAEVPEIAAAPSIEAKAEFLENSVERLSKALESSRKAQAEKEKLLIANDDLKNKLKPLEDFIAYKETFADDLGKLGVEVNTPKDALSKLLRAEATNASNLEEFARASEQLITARTELKNANEALFKAQSAAKQELNLAVAAAKQEAETLANALKAAAVAEKAAAVAEKAAAVAEAKEQVRAEMAAEMSRLRAELDALRAGTAPAAPVRGVAPASAEEIAARPTARPMQNPDNNTGPENDLDNKPK